MTDQPEEKQPAPSDNVDPTTDAWLDRAVVALNRIETDDDFRKQISKMIS